MLSVVGGIADDSLEEPPEDRACLLVHQTRDALHTATASQTTDGWLGDALNAVAKRLSVALGAALTETLAAHATS